MLDAMAPQKHHQHQSGAASPLLLAPITNVSSSPSSSSSASSSSSSSCSESKQQQQLQQHHQKNHNSEAHDDSKTTSTTNNATQQDSHNHQQATNTAISGTSGYKHFHSSNAPAAIQKSKTTVRDQTAAAAVASSKAPFLSSSPATSMTTSTTPAGISSTTSTMTTNQLAQNHHHHSASNQHNNNNNNNNSGNVYQSSQRYSHHNNHSNSNNHSHHNHASYATRSSNQQRGHNNHNSNQKSSHLHHHHNHQHNQSYGNGNDHHHNQKHQQHHQQHQPPQQSLPLPFTSSSSSISLPGSDVAPNSSSGANQRGSSCGPPHYVDLHVNAGECVSLQMLDGQEQFLTGPATITMISQQQNPPVPIPVQVPPGHMVHQIADENGTLRHIILSVMDIDDNSQLNSSVIDLPHGSFRINSHGELVSADVDGTSGNSNVVSGAENETHSNQVMGSSSSSSSIAQQANTATGQHHLQHLPQHQQATTYYANYDGCPVANYGVATQNNINTNNSSNNNNNNNNISSNNNDNLAIEGEAEAGAQHQQANKLANDNNTNLSATTISEIDDANDNSTNHLSLPIETMDSKKTLNDDQRQENASDQQTTTSYTKPTEESLQNDQQMIADMQPQASIDEPAAYQQQVDQTNTMMAAQPAIHQGQMLSTVDEQALYGYPPCCYCCFCDPSQEAAVAGQPQHHHQHQPMLVGPQPEPPTMIKPSDLGAAPQSSNIAGPSSRGGTDPATVSGPLPYHPHQHHQQQQPPSMMTPIQAADPSLAMPLNMSSAPLISSQALHPLTGQNGLVPMQAANLHYPQEHLASSPPTKPHKASRGGGAHNSNNTYKQTKAQQNSDRQHQANYNAGHHHHYGNQSYNNMVAGSTYYHQDLGSGLSPSSYKPPPSGQAAGGGLLSHPTVMVGSTASPATQGTYANSYSNYNQPSTMANIVSASGKQQSAGLHQNQPGNNSYSRSGDLEHHLNQRNGRLEHQMGAGSVAPYTGLNSGYRTDKRPPLVGEKGPRFSGGTSAAASVIGGNGRVIPNNHVGAMVNANATANNHHHSQHHNSHHGHHQTNSGNNSNSSSIGGSVSPFRPNRMKNNSYHHNNHVHQQHSLPPTSSRGSNSNQISSYPHKINKEDLESTARPNQLTAKPGTTATKNLNANNTVHQQPQSLVTNKHIRSNDRNSSSPSSNHSSFNNHSHQSPHRPKAWQQKQQHAPLASNSANNVTLGSSASATPTSPIFAADQQHSAARKNQHHQHEPSASKQDNYLGSPEPAQQQPVERPIKGQHQTVVASVAGSRTSRGKQKKCQKENIAQQQTNHKRQHSNDETRKSAKNHRPRSINEVQQQQQQQQQQASKNLDCTEMSEGQDRFENVQVKRANRQEPNSNKPNQANNNKLAKIEPETNELANGNEQAGDERQQADEQSNNTEVHEAEEADSLNDHREPCQTIESHESVECEQPARPEITPVLTDEQQASTRKQTDTNITTMGQEARSCKSPGKGDSPARKKSKSSGSSKQSSPKAIVDTSAELSAKNQSESSSSGPASGEDVLIVTGSSDQPSIELKPAQVKQTIAVSMRTSLSENNIQSLNVASLNVAKSTQTTPHKQSATTDQVDTNLEATLAAKKKPETSQSSSNLTSKRKSSNGKTEQQFKLNSLPQVRLLNLSCVSVTSNSVNLRWSYITSLAEKYGINHHNQHHHHHGGNPKHSFCFDHYVVECSSAKNVDTNNLVSAKIVYQGCAMTCRINNLTPEKVYHFRIRRTALVPSNDADNLAVSEILSVTLPSIQQQQQQTKDLTTASSGLHHKKQSQHLMAGADSNATTLVSTSNSTATSATARGNTSSQINAHSGNNSNNKSSSSHHHQSHHHHHHHHNHNHQHIKFPNLMRQCRNKIMATLGSVIHNSFSSYSDTKFALLLLVIFTIFAMLLAIFIHLYILPPVNE